jgi:hypothetical protein
LNISQARAPPSPARPRRSRQTLTRASAFVSIVPRTTGHAALRSAGRAMKTYPDVRLDHDVPAPRGLHRPPMRVDVREACKISMPCGCEHERGCGSLPVGGHDLVDGAPLGAQYTHATLTLTLTRICLWLCKPTGSHASTPGHRQTPYPIRRRLHRLLDL